MTSSNPPTAWRPTREVEFIVGTPPGGGQDRPARTLMRILEAARLVDVPMKLTNLPGNGGGHAWDALRARAGDPHVLSISAPLKTTGPVGPCGLGEPPRGSTLMASAGTCRNGCATVSRTAR